MNVAKKMREPKKLQRNKRPDGSDVPFLYLPREICDLIDYNAGDKFNVYFSYTLSPERVVMMRFVKMTEENL